VIFTNNTLTRKQLKQGLPSSLAETRPLRDPVTSREVIVSIQFWGHLSLRLWHWLTLLVWKANDFPHRGAKQCVEPATSFWKVVWGVHSFQSSNRTDLPIHKSKVLRQEHISGQGMFTSLAETLCTGYKHVLLLRKAGSASTGRYPFQPPNMPGLSPPLGVLRFIKFQ
jgi:hypothetical protein